jgi:hypothetical protein
VADRLTIPPRYNGPPASGHGGYTSGVVALAAGGEVAVSLRVPPPLDRELTTARDDGRFVVRDGDTVVAIAEPADVRVDPPPMPEPAEAGPDDPVYGELDEHPFPGCFACGPDRAPGDGLRIFATRTAGRDDLVAAPWIPHPTLAPSGEEVAPEFIWAALDCPTGHACAIEKPAVLARLAVRILAPVRAGAPHVVAAWRTGRDGRKHTAAGCLYAADGTPLAVSEALWVELRDPSAMGAAG